jgi:hypothetical protein
MSKKFVTVYVKDGKEYMSEIIASTTEIADTKLHQEGRRNEKVIGEFVKEIDSEGIENRLKNDKNS